jgi:serine/threonine-protein kinase
MGTVYRAWQRSIGRELAIKLIDRRFARDLMSVKRFLREARLASQLSHPHTVSVFDFGQCADGRLFIAMELIRGRTLQELVDAEGAFAHGRALRIGVQLCDALQAAHKLDIIHRDLKLANVIVLDDAPGRDLIKVLDFGLAKSAAEIETTGTQSGIVVGTPRYMAPEVAAGAAPAPGGDLYAVGVMLGEMVMGKPLWTETNFAALMAQKQKPGQVIRDFPEAIRPILAALLDPDPANRPASADEVRTALLALVADTSSAAGSKKPKGPASPMLGSPTVPLKGNTPARTPVVETKRSRLPIVLGLAVIAVAAVLVYMKTRPEPASQPTTQAPAPSPPQPSTPSPPTPTPPTPKPPPPPAPVQVKLTITSKPAGATIILDGKTLADKTPTTVSIDRGDRAVPIKLQLGKRTATGSITPDHDRSIELQLKAPRTTRPGTGTTPF